MDMSPIIYCPKCIIGDSDILIVYKRKSENTIGFSEREVNGKHMTIKIFLEELHPTKYIMKLRCGHYFHEACIQPYFQDL